MVELRGCAAAVKLCLLLLLMVVGCMSVPLEAKLASDRLKDIDFSYSVPGDSETIFFLPEAAQYDGLCARILSPPRLVNPQGESYCGSVDEYSKIILPISSNSSHSISSVNYAKGEVSFKTIWFHDLVVIEYTFYDASGALVVLDSSTVYVNGGFKKTQRTTLVKTYFNLVMPVTSIGQLPLGGRVTRFVPEKYFAYNINRTLALRFETDAFARKYASDTVFEAVGVFDSRFPSHFRTVDAPMIEPASWFYSITPRFLKSTLQNLQQTPIDTYSHITDMNNAEFKVNRKSKQVVDLTETVPEEVLGYPIWGYIEFVFSPQELKKNRFIVAPSSRRLMTDPNVSPSVSTTTSNTLDGSPLSLLANKFKFPTALWGQPKTPTTSGSVDPIKKKIELCIWGSSKMDGQKQIWLHQLEHLDREQFGFTWIMADVGVPLADPLKPDTNKNAVMDRLASLSHVKLVQSPYNDPLSFEDLQQKPSDGSPSAWEIWNNEVDNVYRYVIHRLKTANYDIDQMSPPWARDMIRKMRDHIIRDGCDIIIYGNNRGYNADVMITYTARLLNVPTVTELLNLYTDPDIVPDVIIGPSVYAVQHDSISSLRIHPLVTDPDSTNTGIAPRMLVISPSVDINRFSQHKPAVDFPALHSKSGTVSNSRPFVVGFVGRLSVEKNVGLFILAAYEIIQNFKERYGSIDSGALSSKIHFIVIGDGDLKQHMFQLCVMLDIVQYVEFASWLSGDAYLAALRTVDVLVNPSIRSWSETFCIANIESMAMSIPLITFGIGGVGEYIDVDMSLEDKMMLTSPNAQLFNLANNAVLVEEATATAIAAAVMHLYLSEPVRRHIGEAGRATVERHFHATLQMQQYQELYRDIMRTASGSSRKL